MHCKPNLCKQHNANIPLWQQRSQQVNKLMLACVVLNGTVLVHLQILLTLTNTHTNTQASVAVHHFHVLFLYKPLTALLVLADYIKSNCVYWLFDGSNQAVSTYF